MAIFLLQKNIHKIGFIGKYKNQNIKKKAGILISLGNSRIGYQDNFKISLRLFSHRNYRKYLFYVDKHLFQMKKKIPKISKLQIFQIKCLRTLR